MQPGTRGNPNANILVVGEAYGAEEEKQNQPFVGQSGQELDRMLLEAGINPIECYYTNVVNKRPQDNKMYKFFVPTVLAKQLGLQPLRGLYPDIPVLEGLLALERLIEKLQPKVIIAFGNYSLWALTEKSFSVKSGTKDAKGWKVPAGIGNYRGSQLRSHYGQTPIVPTYHPAAILRNWAWRVDAVHDIKCRVRCALEGRWNEPERNYIIQPSFDQVMEVLTDLLLKAEASTRPMLLVCDIETVGHFIENIGLGWSRRDAMCIPIMAYGYPGGYWSAADEVEILVTVGKLISHPNVEICGQNFFYDYQHLVYHLHTLPNWKHDTLIAHNTCFPGTPADLVHISSMYCDWHSYWKDDNKEGAMNQDNLQKWAYNCRDCVVTFESIEELWKVLTHFDLEQRYAIQMVRCLSILQPMLQGVKTDPKKRQAEMVVHFDTINTMTAYLEASVPDSLYPRKAKKASFHSSPPQMMELFYDVLGVPEVLDKVSGNRTIDDDALTKIMRREPALTVFCRHMKELRSMSAFSQFLTMKVSEDGRMRCSYSPTTETYRYRSSEDVFGTGRNTQNIPKGKEEDE